MNALNNELVDFIGHEEIEAFDEVRSMCFFKNKKEENAFWTQVLFAGKCNALHEMTMENFECAYIKARQILCKRGQDIFRPYANKHTVRNLQYAIAVKRIRGY